MIELVAVYLAVIALGGLSAYLIYDRARERKEHLFERRELMNRIQHPEYLPVLGVEDARLPTQDDLGFNPPADPDADELGLVGTVQATPGEELD